MKKYRDLKVGDRYYGFDGEVNVVCGHGLYFCSDSSIKLNIRRLRSKHVDNFSLSGENVPNTEVYMYYGRESSSFYAGFRAACDIIVPHMQIFDKENAEVEHPFQQHLTMMKAYKNWIKNT